MTQKQEVFCEDCGGITTGTKTTATHDSGMTFFRYTCTRCGAEDRTARAVRNEDVWERETVKSVTSPEVTERLKILRDHGISPRVEDRDEDAHHSEGDR